ncbi:MAG TPA: serine protease [Polyangiaceae bacterium]|nr:serine protease [Polyangiaceae bacterium]
MKTLSKRARVWAAAVGLAAAGCGGKGAAPRAAPAPAPAPAAESATRGVFETVAPSVVAILNDDEADRRAEQDEFAKALGAEPKAPQKVVDVSRSKEKTPHGTGFLVEGGLVVTAAHVVLRPDRLRVMTRGGQSTGAKVHAIDEIRDVAVLRPDEPLKGAPPLALWGQGEVPVGSAVWALGHTGQGLWALSWGISEGIASGIVDMLGAKLLLFDAPVYPGFSGGPVVARGPDGRLAVVGVNHAILFTGGVMPVATISSAAAAGEVRAVVAGRPHPLEGALAAYAKQERAKPKAQLFITDALAVHRDLQGQQLAEIRGNATALRADPSGQARVPVAAMVFHLPEGKRDLTFELHEPGGELVDTVTKPLRSRRRVGFLSATLRAGVRASGTYEVVAKQGGAPVGHARVEILAPGDDENDIDEGELVGARDGEPTVEVVVASGGRDEPLVLSGVRASWAERSYPRRVDFTWFARGSRGWSGTNVAVNAFVLDEKGRVVGRSVGCFRPELRPEQSWSCMGTGGTPLAMREGAYDVVFTLNERPVALWPMEAVVRLDAESLLKKRLERIERQKRAPAATPPPPPPPPPPAAPPPKPSRKKPPRR